jgi:hypothetical protein
MDEIQERITRIETYLIGIDGKNGLRGTIDNILSGQEEIKKMFQDFIIKREETCPIKKRKYGNLPMIAIWISSIVGISTIGNILYQILK